MAKTYYENPFSGKRWNTANTRNIVAYNAAIRDIERHNMADMERHFPELSVSQLVFNCKNYTKVPNSYSSIGKYYDAMRITHGTSRYWKKPTKWNEDKRRYDSFVSIKEQKEWNDNKKKEFIKKNGTDTFFNDPDYQRKMLAARKVSGEYVFKRTNNKIPYTGKFELDFLEYINTVWNLDSSDIFEAPEHMYEYKGVTRVYIPDFYIPSLNLIIEIKGDLYNNPNRDKKKELAKKNSIKQYDYLFILNKDYSRLDEILEDGGYIKR